MADYCRNATIHEHAAWVVGGLQVTTSQVAMLNKHSLSGLVRRGPSPAGTLYDLEVLN